MKKSTPYDVVFFRYLTEKSATLEQLQHSNSNRCTSRCTSPKYLFVVDKRANKREIADALEEIYADSKIRVKKVNTLRVKPKKRRVRGRKGFRAGFKKAIVTLNAGDAIDEGV